MSVQFDVFSDILRLIRLNGTVYFRLCFDSHWGMDVEPSQYKMFYIVVGGECWLNGAFTDAPIRLIPGDLLTFPHGDAHQITGINYTSGSGIVFRPHSELPKADHHGETPSPTQQGMTNLSWGHIEFHNNILHPFLKHLPPLIHIRGAERGDVDWLRSVTHKLIQESQSPLPGSAVVIDRLAEILHLYMLRAFMLEGASPDGYWKVFSDVQVYQALQHIHAAPESPWTLEALARKVGLSRTALATRFRDKVDMTPMRYITLWRMQKALDLLATTTLSTYEVAQRVGYGSEAALTRALQRQFSLTPGQARQFK